MFSTMMEASSPLATMQPPTWNYHTYNNRDFMPVAAPRSFGPNDFNFKDLSMRMAMKKVQPDYFSMRQIQGSSPTTELAADLSQNFTIDQSPVVPTPRRALFSNNIFATRNHVLVTTPPVPSSSPGAQDIDMDLSPLPHKPSYYQVALQSPTPDLTPNEPSLCLMSPPTSHDRPDSAPPMLQPERRKPAPLRPSLSRAKTLSSNLIEVQRPTLPAFKFGNYPENKPVTSSSLSLQQIFEESSPLRESLSPAPAFAVPRPRVLFDSTNTRNGSPLSSHMRKVSTQTNPIRPKKMFRRAQSMYQTADDVMRQDVLPPMPITTVEHQLTLPTIPKNDQPNELPRISKETMIQILDGKYDAQYKQRVVIDCRFKYEYDGGHIEGARNYNDKETLASQLFEVEPALPTACGDPAKPSLIIFHCEYSAHRAPLMAKFIRNKDRAVNVERYPALTYPEMYILDGGYSSFFKDHRSRCDPQNYVEMDAKEHAAACERGMGKVKQAQRSKLMRAQTFAFGQHSPAPLDSSPTAMSRSRIDDDMDLDMCVDFTPVRPDPRRSNCRMLSFPGAFVHS